MERNKNLLKLHLGCGSNIKQGYLNIDQYVNSPGIIQMDIFNLAIESEFVDEIYTEHMLEHLSKFEVPLALKEWARVLKPDGKLVMNLPNLEWCLDQWLAKTEEERWGWQLDTIFGLQTHLGEFHKTGFTEQRLHQLLTDAGFMNIEISEHWSHGQSCFWVEASKNNLLNKYEGLIQAAVNQTEKFLDDIPNINLVNPHENASLVSTIKSVSIVVPWWDHSELLEIWERNLFFLKDYEIIFVDNGSQIKARQELQEFCHKHNIHLIRNEKNKGFAAANNQGLAVATGEYIIYLNNDIEILNSPASILCDLAINGISGPGLMYNELCEDYIEGWALCIKKSLLEALGGWCEDYGPGYWDDVDLCHRAKLAGYSLIPLPNLHDWIRHRQNTTGRDGRINQLELHHRNRGIFISKHYSIHPKIIVDGVFFQLYQTGIARVWKSLIEEWLDSSFAQYVVVLDRAETAPKIAGIRYRTIPAYNYDHTDADREMLQQVCDEEGADLFISSYYTTPITTPSVFMAYDMIPEVMGWDMNNPMWQEKHHAIQHASAYITISQNTANDLINCFPDVEKTSVAVAHCGVKNSFSPATLTDINNWKNKYGITKPYFIVVGGGGGYKNSILFFQAFSQLASSRGFDIVFTGSGVLAPEFRAYTSGSTVHTLQLSDEELAIAYSGALALVYPSKYEGFGMPVVEAMACGCPVITCPNGSIPEVAEEAVIYVKDNDIDGLINTLCEIQKPNVRKSLITAGLVQAKKFSWSKMAEIVSSVLVDTTILSLNLKEINLIIFPDWSQTEEIIGSELEQVIKAIATHPHSENTTLLINTGNIAIEDAELFLSSVAMNLLVQEDLDAIEGLEISLVSNLADIQWATLLPHIHARIVLAYEDKNALMQTKAETLVFYKIEEFIQDKQFFFT